MRGWIYVASARGDPGRVRIGESAIDPRQGSWRATGGNLHYDAMVDAPGSTVATVHARLRTLRTADGLYRCSPEFAIAAIHHALGGPPPSERIYDTADQGSRPEPPRPVARPGERGGSTASVAMPAVGALVAAALAAWMTLRPPVTVDTPRSDTTMPPQTAPSTRLGPARTISGVVPDPTPAPAATGSPAGSPEAAPPGPQPREFAPAGAPPNEQECAALESLLARCAARRGRQCTGGTAALAAQDRHVMRDMQRAGTSFDVAALDNFCRAACRHGYRPAQADFSATVCRTPQ